MAVTTTNEKLALMSWMQPWQLPLPISADGLGQTDIQQLLWGYPGILWEAPAVAAPYGRRLDLKRGMNTSRIDLVRGG